MICRRITFVFTLICFLSDLATQATAQNDFEDKHLEVSLRMIGHRVLLNAADSVSKVLPVIEENGQYRIEFESEFGFQPDDLVQAVSEVMSENEVAIRYIVEVQECKTEVVVYSFEIDHANQKDIIPCNTRGQPQECFSLVFTILEKPQTATNAIAEEQKDAFSPISGSTIFVLLLLSAVGVAFYYRKKNKSTLDGIIKLGKYQFDQRNALLIFAEERTELTSKEADLLALLHRSTNNPVKRETILNEIWEDEGNYVGRTLDVFISKLRAKLHADPSVKIVNIRGVGYKLVINN